MPNSAPQKGWFKEHHATPLVSTIAFLTGALGCLLFLLTGYGHWFALLLVTVALVGLEHGLPSSIWFSFLPPTISTLLMWWRGAEPIKLLQDNLMFLFICLLIGAAVGYHRTINLRLRKAYQEIRTLRGFLPICANCKSIRDDHGYWLEIEDYLHRNSEAELSHGLCPDCSAEILAEDLPDFEPQPAGNGRSSPRPPTTM